MGNSGVILDVRWLCENTHYVRFGLEVWFASERARAVLTVL